MKKMLMMVVLLCAVMAVGMAQAAVTGCIDAYTYNDTGNATNVTAGNVCINETDYDVGPTAAVYCDVEYACADGACAATEYYTGYAGDGTANCSTANWTESGSTYDVPDNYIINVTENATSCSITDTGETATYDACLNAYTRQGPDGYCDGAGALDTNDALLNVSAGNVCIAGVDANPNATYKCGLWSDCVAGNTTAAEYYVGYAGDGTATCVSTGWVAAGSTFTTEVGQFIRTTEKVDTCSVYGYARQYSETDLKKIVEDGLGTAGAETVSWLDILVLALVVGFIIGVFMKWRGMF